MPHSVTTQPPSGHLPGFLYQKGRLLSRAALSEPTGPANGIFTVGGVRIPHSIATSPDQPYPNPEPTTRPTPATQIIRSGPRITRIQYACGCCLTFWGEC